MILMIALFYNPIKITNYVPCWHKIYEWLSLMSLLSVEEVSSHKKKKRKKKKPTHNYMFNVYIPRGWISLQKK